MPPSAPDRRALEAELREPELAALCEWCELWEVAVEDWPDTQRLGCFLDIALGRFLSRLPSGWSSRRQLREAAGHFSLPFASLRKRYQRAGVDPGARRVTPLGHVVDLEAEREASRRRRERAG